MSVVGDTKGKTLPARAYTSPEIHGTAKCQ